MGGDGLDRKLAAIFYADVAEYSRLTGVDEEGTHKKLSAYLDAISHHIAGKGGRVLHFAGDAILAEFASVVVAVACAVEVQRDLAARNECLADDRRVQFRIGVNLGDVIVDRDELYGDSVNIAARLETLAEPGGICISRKVLDEVRDKLDVGFAFLGEKSVKNIAKPVFVYRVLLTPGTPGEIIGEPSTSRWGGRSIFVATAVVILVAVVGVAAVWWPRSAEEEPQPLARPAFPLPEKPSIAVLPFTNLSGDPGQEHVADGITEDIITALSQVSDMFVIARNSTFAYKGKPLEVRKVAAELGVRYVLEGSIQKSGDRLRVHAQLIDSSSASHLWAERYERQLTDLFDLQDEITERIVTALQIELTEGEQMRVRRKHTRNLRAWNLVAKGAGLFYHRERTKNAMARQLFMEAIEIDPNYALAYSVLAWTHWLDAQFGWSDRPDMSFKRAAELAEKARALDHMLPDVYALQGGIELIEEQYDAAVAAGEKAVALNPNHSTNTALLALFLHHAGRPKEGVIKMKRAMRLSPYYPAWFLEQLGFSYLDSDEPHEALTAFAKFLEREPDGKHAAHAHIGRALSFHAIERPDDARKAVSAAIIADPTISVGQFRQDSLNRGVRNRENALAILGELGLPE